jgi:hypothetical protein
MCMVMCGFGDDERLFESLSRIEWVVPQGPSEHGRYPVICFCVTFCDRCCVWQTLPAHACHARSIADVYTGCQNLFLSRNDSDGACLLVCVVLRSACSAMLESNVYAGAQSFSTSSNGASYFCQQFFAHGLLSAGHYGTMTLCVSEESGWLHGCTNLWVTIKRKGK